MIKSKKNCYRAKVKKELPDTMGTTGHEYNYISEVPMRQSPPVGYVNTGTGLAEARPSEDQQYEDVGRNQTNFPQMYSTPIQETNRENVPIPQVCKYSNITFEA